MERFRENASYPLRGFRGKHREKPPRFRGRFRNPVGGPQDAPVFFAVQHVRRIVWGRLLARAEKRDGEIIRAARILVRSPQQTTNRERAKLTEQTSSDQRA